MSCPTCGHTMQSLGMEEMQGTKLYLKMVLLC